MEVSKMIHAKVDLRKGPFGWLIPNLPTPGQRFMATSHNVFVSGSYAELLPAHTNYFPMYMLLLTRRDTLVCDFLIAIDLLHSGLAVMLFSISASLGLHSYYRASQGQLCPIDGGVRALASSGLS